jgi:hypothetical protein
MVSISYTPTVHDSFAENSKLDMKDSHLVVEEDSCHSPAPSKSFHPMDVDTSSHNHGESSTLELERDAQEHLATRSMPEMHQKE